MYAMLCTLLAVALSMVLHDKPSRLIVEAVQQCYDSTLYTSGRDSSS